MKEFVYNLVIGVVNLLAPERKSPSLLGYDENRLNFMLMVCFMFSILKCVSFKVSSIHLFYFWSPMAKPSLFSHSIAT